MSSSETGSDLLLKGQGRASGDTGGLQVPSLPPSLRSVEQWWTHSVASVTEEEWQDQGLLLKYVKEESCPSAPVLAVGENGDLAKDCWVSVMA